MPSIVLTDVSYTWPDGTRVLSGTTATLGRGRTALVGRNGTGKSTLLRLVAGLLTPSGGTVSVSGTVGYLRQGLALQTDATLADLLGIRARRDALHALAAGDASPAVFDAIGDDWDIEERSLAQLAALGVAVDDLDRRVGALSGGETVLAGLAGVRLAGAAVTLLDEPTNNLDRRARDALYSAIDGWRGALVVVSHDRALLELVDETAELHASSLRIVGGPLSLLEKTLAAEREVAERGLRGAEQQLRTEKRQRIEAETKLAHRDRAAKKAAESMPKILANHLRNSSEKSAAKYRGLRDDRLEAARSAVDEAEAGVRDDDRIRVELPGTAVPAGRRLLVVDGIEVIGPERVALVGDNGVGKTTLLERIARGDVEFVTPALGYLPQRLDQLDARSTVIEAVRAGTEATAGEARAHLARFLLRGRAVEQPVATLSGGERLRVALAHVLLADPPPQLLVLDEPTNDLDLESVDQLAHALAGYRGALLVVSHDDAFLEAIRIDRRLRMSREAGLEVVEETYPPPVL